MKKTKLCICGCGNKVPSGKRFLRGHNTRLTDPDDPAKPDNGFKRGHKHGKGRPSGSRNKVTLASENLLAGESEALTRKAIELALDGNVPALKMCIERLVPVPKSRPVHIKLPKIDDVSQVAEISQSILDNVSAGAITPTEAAQLSAIAANHVRSLQVCEIDVRLSELEAQLEQR